MDIVGGGARGVRWKICRANARFVNMIINVGATHESPMNKNATFADNNTLLANQMRMRESWNAKYSVVRS